MSLNSQNVSQWLSQDLNISLVAPNDYKAHGRQGRHPYRHVIKHEAKHMNIKKVENPTENENRLHYSTIIIDVADIKAYFDVMFQSFKRNYLIQQDEYEHCYDWVINEAISKIVSVAGSNLKNHSRHDVYKCVYDEIGNLVEKNLREAFARLGYTFLIGSKVKSMVCGPTLMLARSVNG